MALSTETRVGLFALSGLGVFAMGVLILGDFQFHGTYPLNVYFANADGLPENGSVKVAGVEVGKIASVGLDGPRARVHIRLRRDLAVHQGARAHVASTGLIGSKYMELTLGDSSRPRLQPGDAVEGTPGFSFDDAMRQLGDFLRDDPRQGATTENLRIILANFRQVSQALADSIGQQGMEMTDIVRNIRDASAQAKRLTTGLADIVSARDEDIQTALANFRSVSERLDRILANVEEGDGMLTKLINDPDMGQRLESTMENVNTATKDMKGFIGRVADIEIYWDYRQRYDLEVAKAHPDLGLYMSPRPGKFYYIGGNNLGSRQDRQQPGADIERRNTVTALLGFDFGPWTLSGGAIRSAGGARAQWRPLPASAGWHRRFELEAEAFDFGRNETVQGIVFDQPVVNAGARVKVIDPWLWVGAQVEDIAVQKNVVVNANLHFRDEDLAFLFGLIGLAR